MNATNDQIATLQSESDDKTLQLDGLLKVKQFLVAKLKECEEALYVLSNERNALESDFHELESMYQALTLEHNNTLREVDALRQCISASDSKSRTSIDKATADRIHAVETRLNHAISERDESLIRAEAAEAKARALELSIEEMRETQKILATRVADAEVNAEEAQRELQDARAELIDFKHAVASNHGDEFHISRSPYKAGDDEDAFDIDGDDNNEENISHKENNLLRAHVSVLGETLMNAQKEVAAFKRSLEVEHGYRSSSRPSLTGNESPIMGATGVNKTNLPTSPFMNSPVMHSVSPSSKTAEKHTAPLAQSVSVPIPAATAKTSNPRRISSLEVDSGYFGGQNSDVKEDVESFLNSSTNTITPALITTASKTNNANAIAGETGHQGIVVGGSLVGGSGGGKMRVTKKIVVDQV